MTATDSTTSADQDLVRRGADNGHRITVTPLGPAWVTECGCGMKPLRRASKHQANRGGLAHLRSVSLPSPFVTHVGRDADTGVEFLVTTYEDGLVTIATRTDSGATWSPPHALTERRAFAADGSEVDR